LAKQLTTFVVSQFDRNAIANATSELKGVLVRADDFVHVMSQRGNYVDRVVVSSPVHRHTLVVVLVSEHALDRLLVDVTRTHFLEPVEAIYSFKPQSFGCGQSDRDSIVADEFERGLVIVMESFVGEGFIRTAHGDVVAGITPTDIDLVRGNTIETCERALDGLAVDVSRVHESTHSCTSSTDLWLFHEPDALTYRITRLRVMFPTKKPGNLPGFIICPIGRY
jgi:hypothetical protein